MNILNLLFFLLLSQCTFSQVGTYKLGTVPSEGMADCVNAEGILEIPIYIGGSSSIQLKRNGKAIHLYTDEAGHEEKTTGTWTSEGELIRLTMVIDSGSETVEFKLVSYESGTYLRSLRAIAYYKKV